MEGIFTFLGAIWGLTGAAAAFQSGRPYLWRVTIWMGPFAYLFCDFPSETVSEPKQTSPECRNPREQLPRKCRDACLVLGVREDVTLDEVRRRYKEEVSAWHPDRFAAGSNMHDRAQEKLKQLNNAREVLTEFLRSREEASRERERQAREAVDRRRREAEAEAKAAQREREARLQLERDEQHRRERAEQEQRREQERCEQERKEQEKRAAREREVEAHKAKESHRNQEAERAEGLQQRDEQKSQGQRLAVSVAVVFMLVLITFSVVSNHVPPDSPAPRKAEATIDIAVIPTPEVDAVGSSQDVLQTKTEPINHRRVQAPIDSGVKALVVPGSKLIAKQAEAEGLILKNSRDDKTAIELFVAGIQAWETELRRLLS